MHSLTFRSTLNKTDQKYYNEFQESQNAFLDDFSSKHMMTKEMWEQRLNLSRDYQHVVRSIYQFYINGYDCDIAISKRKIMSDDHIFPPHEYALEDFCYPQKELESKLERFDEYACSFMPKPDTIEKLQQMYSDIKAAEGDDEKWLEALMAFDDHEFIFHNVEYRLGGDLTNRSLWLMYIEYLKTHDSKKLLQTYSKFIRFFLDDVEMIDEYRDAVKKYGPVLVPWKNPEDFETYDENFYEKEKDCQSYKRTFYDQSPPCLIRFNPETAARQDFLFFQNPMMIYIRENASPEVLHKLYKCCKLFPARFLKTVCCRMTVGRDDPFNICGHALKFSGDSASNINVDNIFIGNRLYCNYCDDPLALSKFIPKIYRCAANIVKITHQQLTMDELKFLIGHENLSSLMLWSIKNSDGQNFKIEDILQMSPFVKKLNLHDVQCTPETAKKLSEMVFKNKIEWVSLINLNNDLLNPYDFVKFIKKSCKPGALIRIGFEFDGKEAFVKQFKEVVKSAIENHWKGSKKIKFCF